MEVAIKKAKADYMNGAEWQTASAHIYMVGFEEAKILVAQAHLDLDLFAIKLVVDEDTISQVAEKSKVSRTKGQRSMTPNPNLPLNQRPL